MADGEGVCPPKKIKKLHWLTVRQPSTGSHRFLGAVATVTPEKGRCVMSTAPGKAPPKNLDVLGIDRVPAIGCNKGFPAELPCVTHLSSLGAHTAQPDQQQKHRRHYRSGGTRYITVAQATNIIQAVERAKSIGLPLVGVSRSPLSLWWHSVHYGRASHQHHRGRRARKIHRSLFGWPCHDPLEPDGRW